MSKLPSCALNAGIISVVFAIPGSIVREHAQAIMHNHYQVSKCGDWQVEDGFVPGCKLKTTGLFKVPPFMEEYVHKGCLLVAV
jgi:hypothetical protein